MNKSSNRLSAMMREPVTVAIVIAVLVAAVLAVVVLAIWSGGPGSNNQLIVPAIEQAAITPTPRAVQWPRSAPAASPLAVRRSSPTVANVPRINALAAAITPTAAPSPRDRPTETPRPSPTDAPEPTPRSSPTPRPTATPEPTEEPDYEATDATSFGRMAGGRWYASGNRLVFDAPQATSEPWILAPHQVPGGDFAVEAEVRVDGLGQGYCNQSFGVVAGSDQLGRFWGGGVLFGCGGTAPLARITDVSTWTDGYDRDRTLASEDFDPEQEWHTLRLEVRGDELTMWIDGEEVLNATDDQLQARLSSGQAGLWTQGVSLTVRRLAIYEL
ncbi:MAG: DUF1080 domain-containing protein [Chloroflexia bacterium]|nr:DUF1080 domain-containing protein [Chloroflexia bacterium]